MEGAERSLLEIIEYLQKKDWTIEIIVPGEGGFTEGLRGLGLHYHVVDVQWWQSIEDDFAPKWVQKNREIASDIARIFREVEVEVVYTNTSVISAGALAAKMLNKPHVWHIRELATGLIFEKHQKVLAKIGGFIAASSNKIIVNSKATRDSWSKFWSSEDSCEVVYNQINAPNYKSGTELKGDDFKIGLIGSILPIKRHIDALCALKILQSEGYSLHIIGPFRNEAYRKELELYIRSNKLGDAVRFYGFQEFPWQIGIEMDLILVPGASEGFGRVGAEAMLLGKPVLAARGGGMLELIEEDKTGYFFNPGDVNDLADKIRSIRELNLEGLNPAAKSGIEKLIAPAVTIGRLEEILENELG
jgi:glycosyltransferase involved in cell wall biosynthesis